MRVPRPRLTVAGLMVLVAIVASLLFLRKLDDRREEAKQKTAETSRLARYFTARAGEVRKLPPSDPRRKLLDEDHARHCDRIAAHYRRLEMAWQDVEARPWRTRPKPEPRPE